MEPNREQYVKVSEEGFYKGIGDKDVILKVEEPYPYKVIFKMRRSEIVVGYQERDGEYYLRRANDE